MSKLDLFIASVPKELTNAPENRRFFDYLIKYLHDLGVRTGGFGDVADLTPQNLSAKLIDMQQAQGSGQFMTWDDNGFTWDTDAFSWDTEEF